MPEYLFLMHDDAVPDESGWPSYLGKLQAAGVFEGGSEIGKGVCLRKEGLPGALSIHLTGFIRIVADNLDAARNYLAGNPVFEAGGTVEIRELPRSD